MKVAAWILLTDRQQVSGSAVASSPLNFAHDRITSGIRRTAAAATLLSLIFVDRTAAATAPNAAQEAWWTGPMLASSGGTLPKGHVLAEPYLFDQRGSGGDYAGSLTYLLYGATDRLRVG